jgi:hypothetical protein|tara:strand:+ start:24 stop:179 length:156 start_codon:yes stop_codon:yes gene_type:complete
MPQSQSIHYGNVKLILLDENTEKKLINNHYCGDDFFRTLSDCFFLDIAGNL